MEVIGLGSSNGINLYRFSSLALSEKKLEEIKALVGYDEKYSYFLSVGRIVHDKGIDELLKAFVESYKKHDHIRLILVGSFEMDLDPISEEAARILKAHPGIIQTGWNEDVEYFMHFAFALIHPSHREGFPNVLLQAGAMNCPIICSRIEGNIDIVEHESTGLLFEVKNEEQLHEHIEAALADPAGMKQYAANLYKKIRENFDQKVVHQQLRKRYQELLMVK